MNTLEVSIERNGSQILVGTIRYNNPGDALFQYDREYVFRSDAAAISVHLPVREDSFTPQETKCFFDGLLPEGFTRRTVAQWIHVNEDDYLTLLAALGEECIGAVRVSPSETPPDTAAYEPLSKTQLREFANQGVVKSAEMLTKSHLSLTGASGKAGLYYEKESDQWYLPVGAAPSTHIVKQSHIRLEDIVLNEHLCLLTADALGIDVPGSFLLPTGDEESATLFATKRFDRCFVPHSERIGGLRRPLRLHQEDFAQALGIESSKKYEPKNGNYLKSSFSLLLKYSADPIADQRKLWDLLIFDYLIGNTDNHIKNISILYSEDLGRIRLAPAYDIISTAVYESSTRDMALSVGGKYGLDEINRSAFLEEAEKLGMGKKMAGDRFDVINDQFESVLRESAHHLAEEGVSGADRLAERILRSGGYES